MHIVFLECVHIIETSVITDMGEHLSKATTSFQVFPAKVI